MTDNRRNFVRIQTRVGLLWRVLSSAEKDTLDAEFALRSRSVGLVSELAYRSEELEPLMRQVAKGQPAVASCLAFLQEAVQTLAVQVADKQSLRAGTVDQDVVISASGMEFSVEQVCSPGELLEVNIELIPPASQAAVALRSRIMVVGEVVAPEDGQEDRQKVAIVFRYIRDADQELLIRHIHRAQLEDLQKARSERNAA